MNKKKKHQNQKKKVNSVNLNWLLNNTHHWGWNTSYHWKRNKKWEKKIKIKPQLHEKHIEDSKAIISLYKRKKNNNTCT